MAGRRPRLTASSLESNPKPPDERGAAYAAPMRSIASGAVGNPPRNARHRARPEPTVHLAERKGYSPGDPDAVSLRGLRGRVLSEYIETVSCSNCRRIHQHGRRGRARVLRQVIGPFGQMRWVSV